MICMISTFIRGVKQFRVEYEHSQLINAIFHSTPNLPFSMRVMADKVDEFVFTAPGIKIDW